MPNPNRWETEKGGNQQTEDRTERKEKNEDLRVGEEPHDDEVEGRIHQQRGQGQRDMQQASQ